MSVEIYIDDLKPDIERQVSFQRRETGMIFGQITNF